MLAFVSEGDTGGAPPFVLSFWAEAADYSCPVSPLHLSAEFGHVKLLKGRVASLLKGRVASLLKCNVASLVRERERERERERDTHTHTHTHTHTKGERER